MTPEEVLVELVTEVSLRDTKHSSSLAKEITVSTQQLKKSERADWTRTVEDNVAQIEEH